jgi:hypothetical protein
MTEQQEEDYGTTVMKSHTLLTLIVILSVGFVMPAESNTDTTRTFDKTYHRDFTSQYRYIWDGGVPSRRDNRRGEQLCEKALKNKTLQRYLSVADKWEEVLGDELMPLEYVKFDGERFFPRDTLKNSENLSNAYWMGDKFLREVEKSGSKIAKGLRDDHWNRYTYPVFLCGAILRGTDEFRLFTESGREISYRRGGCKNEESPFCKGRLGTYTKEKLDPRTGELKTVSYWDKGANPPQVKFYYSNGIYSDLDIRHHNGFLLFVLMLPQGEKALESLEKVLDSWEVAIQKVLLIRKEEADKRRARLALQRAEEEHSQLMKEQERLKLEEETDKRRARLALQRAEEEHSQRMKEQERLKLESALEGRRRKGGETFSEEQERLKLESAREGRRGKEEESIKRLNAYLNRDKTIVEQVLNYTTTGKLEGTDNDYWIESPSCVLTRETSITFLQPKKIDIRTFNETGFKTTVSYVENTIGLGNKMVEWGDADQTFYSFQYEADFFRLQKAWRLAFRECPGSKSAF